MTTTLTVQNGNRQATTIEAWRTVLGGIGHAVQRSAGMLDTVADAVEYAGAAINKARIQQRIDHTVELKGYARQAVQEAALNYTLKAAEIEAQLKKLGKQDLDRFNGFYKELVSELTEQGLMS